MEGTTVSQVMDIAYSQNRLRGTTATAAKHGVGRVIVHRSFAVGAHAVLQGQALLMEQWKKEILDLLASGGSVPLAFDMLRWDETLQALVVQPEELGNQSSMWSTVVGRVLIGWTQQDKDGNEQSYEGG